MGTTTWVRAAVAGSAYKSLPSIEYAKDHIVNSEFTKVLCGKLNPTFLLDDPYAAGKAVLCPKCCYEMIKRGIKLESNEDE